VTKFNTLGTTVTTKNYVSYEVKSRLHSRTHTGGVEDKISVGKTEETRLLGTLKHRSEDTIKRDFKYTECKFVG
jgi:hypothetical protein